LTAASVGHDDGDELGAAPLASVLYFAASYTSGPVYEMTRFVAFLRDADSLSVGLLQLHATPRLYDVGCFDT
jgi:hypothetical protein